MVAFRTIAVHLDFENILKLSNQVFLVPIFILSQTAILILLVFCKICSARLNPEEESYLMIELCENSTFPNLLQHLNILLASTCLGLI